MLLNEIAQTLARHVGAFTGVTLAIPPGAGENMTKPLQLAFFVSLQPGNFQNGISYLESQNIIKIVPLRNTDVFDTVERYRIQGQREQNNPEPSRGTRLFQDAVRDHANHALRLIISRSSGEFDQVGMMYLTVIFERVRTK